MATNFIKDAFNFRYNALLKQEQTIVQGYEDGILSESYLNDFRLEIRFLESELGIKDKYKFRGIEDDKLVYLTDDDEYDYKDLPVLKTIEQKSMAELESTKNLIRKTKNLVNDNFKDLITEPIDVNYSWGKYGKFNIIIRNRDGFINGTFLIKEALTFENELRKNQNQKIIEERTISKWFKNIETINLIETAKIKLGIDSLKDILKLNQYAKFPFLGGTYIHPILVNSLATWVSPSYALEINEIINNMNIEAKLKEERDRTHELLGIKNNIIAQMERNYNELSKDHKMLVVDQRVVLKKLDNTVDRFNNAIGFVEEKKNEIRPTTAKDNIHYLYIYKFINTETEAFVTYTCYRMQPKNLSKELKKINENLKPIEVYKKYSVNAIQAWNKFKLEYGKNIKVSYNDFSLKDNYSEKLLKKDFEKIFSEYKDIKF